MKTKSEQDVIDTVRALLAKAEATTFEEEATTFTAKAQELIARYSIDHLLLIGDSPDESPSNDKINIDAPYARSKATLLFNVARANHCRVIYRPGLGDAVVFGFGADVELVEILYTSLLVQGATALAVSDEPNRGVRSFRHSFWTAYAHRIGIRLKDAAHDVEEEHQSLLPVLQKRDDLVKLASEEAFPTAAAMRPTTISDPHGWSAGHAAANRAAIDIRKAMDG